MGLRNTLSTKYVLTIVLSLFAFAAIAQSDLSKSDLQKLHDKARKNMTLGEFTKGFETYSILLQTDRENPVYNYEMGICIFEGAVDKSKSKKYFEDAAFSDRRDDKEMPDLFYYLGRVYHLERNFVSALAAYNSYLPYLPNNRFGKERGAEVEVYIRQCEEGKDLMEQGTAIDSISQESKNIKKYYVDDDNYIKVENLGDEINTPFSEYGPVIYNQGEILLFTSRKVGTGGVIYSDGQYYEDIYFARDTLDIWTQVNNVNNTDMFDMALVNTNKHDATVSISPDENQIFLFRENQIELLERTDGVWQQPKKFSASFDRAGSHVATATTSPDGNYLYMESERHDAVGGRDIYYSTKQADGSWGDLVNLGATINTTLDESTPYMWDDTTLFFSSKGHSSIGGYDVFMSHKKDTGWTKPVNLKLPINSPFDEVNYSLSRDSSVAYLASNRNEGYGEYDIYRITLNFDQAISDEMLKELEKGKSVDTDSVLASKGASRGPKLISYNDINLNEDGSLDEGTKSALDSLKEILDKNPNITLELVGNAGNTGDHTADALLSKQRAEAAYNYLLNAGVPKSQLKKSFMDMDLVSIADKDAEKPKVASLEQIVYFAFDASYITDYSKGKLNAFIEQLKASDAKEVHLTGHADHRGPEEYNLELSKKRALAVEKYLKENGVDIIITPKWLGESKPRFENAKLKEHIYNRRVELTVF